MGTSNFPRDWELGAPVLLFDAATGAHRGTLQEHRATVRGLAFSPDGKRLASAGHDGKVAVWDAATRERIWVTPPDGLARHTVLFSPSSDLLVSSHHTGLLVGHDAATGQERWRLQAHLGGVQAMDFTDRGRRLVTVGSDRKMHVWDVGSRQRLLTIPLAGSQGRPRAMDVSPDGQRVVVGYFDVGSHLEVYEVGPTKGSLRARQRNRQAADLVFSLLGEHAYVAPSSEALEQSDGLDPDVREAARVLLRNTTGGRQGQARRRAMEYWRAGDAEKAIAMRRAVVAQRPDMSREHYLLGDLLVASGRDTEARQVFLEARELGDRIDAPIALARMASRLYDGDRARAYIAEALEQDPTPSASVAQSIATIYCRLGDLEQAVAYAKRAFDDVEGDDQAALARAHNVVGVRYALLGAEEKGLGHYQQALAAQPDNAQAQANIAHSWYRRGDLERAIAEGRKAMDLDETHARGTLGRALYFKALAAGGRFDEAVAHFESAVRPVDRPNPGRPRPNDLWDCYGHALVAAGRGGEARAILDQLVRDWPQEPCSWAARARFLATCTGGTPDDRRLALEAAEKAVALTERRGPPMLLALAEARLANGDAQGAVRAAEECLQRMNGRNAEDLLLTTVETALQRYREDR